VAGISRPSAASVLMYASCVALGLGRLRLRRAGLRRPLALGHVLPLAAHVLHLLLHVAVHLAVALALALMTLAMVHAAVSIAVRSGVRVLGRAAGAVFMTVSQRPSAGEHRGRRDAADQKYFRVHDCLQRNREVRCLHALEGRDFTEVFQEQRFL
jgi:hypothetical protein